VIRQVRVFSPILEKLIIGCSDSLFTGLLFWSISIISSLTKISNLLIILSGFVALQYNSYPLPTLNFLGSLYIKSPPSIGLNSNLSMIDGIAPSLEVPLTKFQTYSPNSIRIDSLLSEWVLSVSSKSPS